MHAVRIPDPWIIDYKCQKNLFNLPSTGVKYLGIMSSSVIHVISVSYWTGDTFHTVNIQSYILGKTCKCHERIMPITKYCIEDARGRLMYCKFQLFSASRDIQYCINKQISILIHPFIQISFKLSNNKTPLCKPRKNYQHISYRLDQYFVLLGCLVFFKINFCVIIKY